MKYMLLDDNNGRGLVQVQDERGNECWVTREKYEIATCSKVRTKDAGFLRYSMDYDRAVRPWAFTQWFSELAWVVGFAAQQNAYLRHSGTPNAGTVVEDEFEFGADSHGEKFDVVIPNPNCAGLDDVLDLNFSQRTSVRCVSLNKQGFYRFLESIGFQIGRDQEQCVHNIRKSIPAEYMADFEAGLLGSAPAVGLSPTKNN